MSRANLRGAVVLLAVLLLCGCSGLQQLNIPVTGDARAFTQGFDRYMTHGDPAALKALPEGEWQARANQLITLGTEQKQRQAELSKLRQQLKTREQEIEFQKQEIKRLETTLNQLKEVLIDSELKPK